MRTREEMIESGVATLVAGQPLIFPTDTVYGLGVAVGIAHSPQILYDLKRRDYAKPVAWLVANPQALHLYGKAVPEMADVLVGAFWPGPLTVVVEAGDNVPKAFRAPDSTIALRMPDNRLILELIRRVGLPLATTSANVSGQKPPKQFKDLDTDLIRRVGLAIRDDSLKTGLASTIVDCTKDNPVVIREGTITTGDIQSLG